MSLTETDKRYFEELVKSATDHSTKMVVKTIDERFTAYGFDIKSPLEIQKNNIFVDQLRKIVESMVIRAVALIIAGVGVAGFASKFISWKKEGP